MSKLIINTDASFSQETGIGGYAFYIRGDHFISTKSGSLGAGIEGSAQAELMCISNAIAALLSQKDLKKVHSLVLYTDCMPAIDQINDPTISEGLQAWRLWRQLVQRVRPEMALVKHVRAHTAYSSDRAFINNLLDKQAKKWMRKGVKDKINVIGF